MSDFRLYGEKFGTKTAVLNVKSFSSIDEEHFHRDLFWPENHSVECQTSVSVEKERETLRCSCHSAAEISGFQGQISSSCNHHNHQFKKLRNKFTEQPIYRVSKDVSSFLSSLPALCNHHEHQFKK